MQVGEVVDKTGLEVILYLIDYNLMTISPVSHFASSGASWDVSYPMFVILT